MVAYVKRRLKLLLSFIGLALSSIIPLFAQDAKTGSIQDYANSLRTVQRDFTAGRMTEAQERLDSTDKSHRNFEFEFLQKQLQSLRSGGVASDVIQFVPKPEANVRYSVLNELDLRLVSICQDGALRIHDFNSKELHAKTVSYPEGGPIWTGAFSRDGKTFVSGHQNGEAVVWNPATWEAVHKIPVSMKSPVRELIIAPNGSSVVVEGEKFLELWSLEGEKPTKIESVGERLNFGEGLAFSPQGDRLATGGMFDVRLYDAHTGKLLKSMRHASYTMGLEFSPDGNRIASAPRGNVNKFLAVFDVNADKPLFNAGPFGNYIAGMAFTPDGMRIAATGCEKMLRLFDATTGVIVLTIDRNECCSKPAFSRDGRLLGWSEPDGYHFVDISPRRAAE